MQDSRIRYTSSIAACCLKTRNFVLHTKKLLQFSELPTLLSLVGVVIIIGTLAG
ncbi:hypothetical protein [Nostoc sp.]|uniref:hypothetical protein n=1 Tax=Nostoc sp. TaxID=1180 RepID=UPI002A5ECEFA|nr:hypothetical protein [Nostoc sp. S13]